MVGGEDARDAVETRQSLTDLSNDERTAVNRNLNFQACRELLQVWKPVETPQTVE